ncbi:MAG: hypothetical protein ACLTW9_13920 [Enterocloster sp.]
MDIKTLQYVMGHSDVGVTLNVYTHASYDRAAEQMVKVIDFKAAGRQKQEKIRLETNKITTPLTTPFACEFA